MMIYQVEYVIQIKLSGKMMTSICGIYICCLFYFAQINTTKTQPGLGISFQAKLCECFSNLTNFVRLDETVDWSKVLIFDKKKSE